MWTIGENVLKRYTFLYDNAFNALMGACKNKPTIVWAKLFCFVFVETKKYTVKNVGSISTALSSPVPEGPPSEEFGGEGVGEAWPYFPNRPLFKPTVQCSPCRQVVPWRPVLQKHSVYGSHIAELGHLQLSEQLTPYLLIGQIEMKIWKTCWFYNNKKKPATWPQMASLGQDHILVQFTPKNLSGHSWRN